MTDDFKGKYTVPAKEIHAFFVIDDNGEEGIPAFRAVNNTAMPLIATDRVRLAQIYAIAAAMAKMLGKRVEHVKFTTREHVEWLEPDGTT